MKLPSFNFGKKPKADYFLALILQDEKISSFIFEKIAQKITILGRHEEFLETSIDNLSFEELLDFCDKVVSEAEQQTQKDLGILKTIYGLKQAWVSENKIKKEHIDKLQKASQELELAPVGFLTITDAIINLIQKEEGAPPSAILADIGEKFVTVSLLRAGKIVETKTSEIHQSPVFTVDTLLKHLTMPEILPSKIYFVGDEELTQEFIGHQWSKSLPFLHLPQITNLAESFIENAFIEGVAKEMRAEIVGEASEQVPAEKTKEISEPEKIEDAKEEIEKMGEPEKMVEQIADAQSFFGFIEGKDVAKEEPKEIKEVEVPSKAEEEQISEIPQEVKLQRGNRILSIIIPIISAAKDKLGSLLSRIRLPENFGGNRKVLLPIGLLALILLPLIYYFFGMTANIVLSVKPQIEELSQSITFSAIKSSDYKKNIIASESISASLDGEVSKDTTGKKEIGERAKGTVTVFNSSKNTATYPAKTAMKSSNGLNFLTLDKVTVASESADIPPKAGTANVNVEAEKFGTEYNLPSGTKFLSIAGNADIAAKNDNPFSGGTKKEIQAVSKEDLAALEKALIEKFKEEAKTQILNKTGSGKQILPEFIKTAVLKPDFDKEVGDEASKVSLKGNASYQALVFKRDDVLEYSESALIPENSEISRENIKISFKDIKALNDKEAQAQLNVEAKILPKIEKDKITSKILGKSFKDAERDLLTLPNIINVKVSFSPQIPFLPKILPRNSKNINIILEL